MNPDMMADFIANNGEKPKRDPKPPQRLERKRGMERGKGLKPVSDKQAEKLQRWAHYKEAILAYMSRYDELGPHCESCGIPGDTRTLDLDHIRPKGTGGAWDARNGQLLCNRLSKNGDQSCHSRKHGVPRFSPTHDVELRATK